MDGTGTEQLTDWAFQEFPKMARLNRECVITEKIDGTNACIYIADDGVTMFTGSRTRWITPEDDNFGFARWANEHKDELLKLGPGRHFGEWWGSGIQRGYGLPKGEKRFSLFNALRWNPDVLTLPPGAHPVPGVSCVSTVPVLYTGRFDTANVNQVLATLRLGSFVAPFLNPEGVVVYHTAARIGFKVTLENDEQPKSKVK